MVDPVGSEHGDGPAPGWYPDPHARFEQRYYDGSQWTQHVSTGGVVSTDAAAAGYTSPSAVSSLGGLYPAATGRVAGTRMVSRNTIGVGFALACLGWLLLLASTQLEWFDGEALFSMSDPASAAFSAPTWVANFQLQVTTSLAFLILVIIATTLPYQPGKIMGFCYGGCIGLAVCWRRLDANDPSIRSNLLGVFVILAHLVSIWYQINLVTDHLPRYGAAGAGPGVWTFFGGLVVMLAGVLLGRHRRRVAV